jgi:hypothetical protein
MHDTSPAHQSSPSRAAAVNVRIVRASSVRSLAHVVVVVLCNFVQVAVLLAPVAYVTHMDSLPMNALAALDTDEVRHALG